jgi:hypothetical protein
MNMLDCNATTVEEYSCLVCEESASIKAIIAHHHDRSGVLHQDPRMYEGYSFGTWIHMPMDKDEHLDDVWLVSNGNWGSGFMVRLRCLYFVIQSLTNVYNL